MISIDEQRARDALAFDPLPDVTWLKITDEWIFARVNYSERLSAALRAIPGAKWLPDARTWRFPFSSADAIHRDIERIDALAREASERADAETEARKLEKERSDAARREERRDRENARMSSRPRGLRREFLEAKSQIKAALALEAIGDHNARQLMIRAPQRQWVAQIVGLSANGQWARAFLQGARDYSKANSMGSRGIMVTYLLDDGLIYEVSEPRTWRETARWFCRIDGGAIVKLTEAEVRACLA